MDELKACPFCGELPSKYRCPQRGPFECGEPDKFQVICQCGARGPFMPSPAEAIARWNALSTPDGDAVERADEWQDIASAPLDGSRFLAIWLYRPDDPDAGSKSHDVVRWCGWWDSNGFTVPEPTHWRPLPAPPAQAAIAAMGRKGE